jgi:hypothetical protein
MQININMGPISSDDTVQMRLYCHHFRDPYYLHIQGEVKKDPITVYSWLSGWGSFRWQIIRTWF